MKLNSGRLWLRITVYSLLLSLITLVLTQALVYWQFDETQVRSILSRSLQSSGRNVLIEGRITPTLLPSPGINIERLSITQPKSDTPFAHVKEVEIRLSWLALLFGKREVKSIALYGGNASILRDTEGRLSIADLFQTQQQNHFTIKLDSLKIRDGALSFSDQINNSDRRLSSISLDVDDLQSSASLRAGAILDSGAQPVRLAITTPLSIQDDQVRLEAVEAVAISQVNGLGESKLSLSGQYQLNFSALQASGNQVLLTFSSERPNSELRLAMPQINASLTELSVPTGTLTAKVQYARSQYQLDATLENLKLDHTGLYANQLNGDFNWQAEDTRINVKLNAPVSLIAMQQLEMQPLVLTSTLTTPLLPRGRLVSTMSGSLNGNLEEPRFNLQVAGQLDGSEATLTLNQYGLIKPRHEATLSLSKLDLNRYLPESTGTPVAIFQNTEDIPLGWLDLFDLSGKVKIDELAFGRFRLNNLNSDIRITPREFELSEMSADIYEGRLYGDIGLSRRNQPQLKVKQTLQGMRIRPLLLDLFNFSRVNGKGNGKVDITAQGKSFAQLRNTLNGNVQMELNNGALSGIDLVSALKNLPAEIKEWNSTAQNDQKTTFSTLSGSFQLNKGIARNQNFKLASELVNISGNGKLDLIQNIIDYTMDVQPNPKQFSRFQGVNIPLKITGPVSAPIYALDFNAMVKGKKTEAEKQQALKQELGKQINSILP
ncbi:AsmA family protein [Neisseriaceae bacterium TC5R-5]|nr:AsmA family protein [Neisseriaceae bacterium TC5R-5]